MTLCRIISKKLQIDDHNDSLLEEPVIKKFIGVSQNMRASPNTSRVKQKLNMKLLTPQVQSPIVTARKRFMSVSPS